MSRKTAFQIMTDGEIESIAYIMGAEVPSDIPYFAIESYRDPDDRRCIIFAALGLAPLLMTENSYI